MVDESVYIVTELEFVFEISKFGDQLKDGLYIVSTNSSIFKESPSHIDESVN